MRHWIDSLGRVLFSMASAVAFVALPLGGALAEMQSREVGPFSAIRMEGPGILDIGVGDRETVAVEATAELMAHIITTVDDHTLVIKYDLGFSHAAETPKFHITLPRLDAIDAHGSGRVSITGLSGGSLRASVYGAWAISASGRTDRLALALEGAATADFTALSATDAQVTIDGSGRVADLAATDAQVTINGSGSVADLAATGAQVTINGSGSVALRAVQSLDLTINGAGRVISRTTPAHLSQKINGAGSVQIGNGQ